MRTILIALMLAVASAAAAAQTAEGPADRPGLLSRWVEEITDGRLERREAAVEEREAALEDRQAGLEEREAAVQKREEAVRQQEETNRRRTRGLRYQADALRGAEETRTAEFQEQTDVLTAEFQEQADALREREAQLEEDVTNALLEAEQVLERSSGIAWAAVILGGGVGFWSLWRLQPSTVARLNQRRRAAEQGLASMQASETRLRHRSERKQGL